jgi:predicted nuclease of restriction endonuclease-like (RecB) superfamily
MPSTRNISRRQIKPAANTRQPRKNNFDDLVDNIYQTHCALQDNAARAINYGLTIRNWLVGHHIVEFEQNGRDRAKYGDNLISELAIKLKKKGMKGLSITALKDHRTFYIYYPQISQSVISLLKSMEETALPDVGFIKSRTLAGLLIDINATHSPSATSRKGQSVTGFFVDIQKSPPPALIRKSQSLTGLFVSTPAPSKKTGVGLTTPAKQKNNTQLSSELLLSRLTYTHFMELIRVDDDLQRLFYEVEAIKNNWSVRELKRAIATSLAYRTAMSTNKQAVIAKIKNLKPASNIEVIRNPYVLEFMDLHEKPEYTETDLEERIITHLQQFLVELGAGFCFEARQKRITFNNKHYRIDLVFYHRILKCHVLVDLKVNEFDHSDAGQMNLYLNYYKKNEMTADDNPPIGIILCSDKDDTLVEYATAGMDDHLFVSKYLVNLPDKKLLENFIRKELAQHADG